MPSNRAFHKSLQNFAEDTAIKAGKILLQEQTRFKIVKQKDIQDIATTADLKSEKFIISQIEKKFPHHNILSEEIGSINNNSQFTWIIDPLDGTKEYVKGLPEFEVLISCETSKDIIASCLYRPSTNKLFSSSKDVGAFEDRKEITISKRQKLSHSFISTHLPSGGHKGSMFKEAEFTKIWNYTSKIAENSYRLRGSSFNAYNLCLLAKGIFDGYFIFHNFADNWWDISAGLLIAKEAGAKITDLAGKPLKHKTTRGGLLVSNGKIHDQLLKLLNPTSPNKL